MAWARLLHLLFGDTVLAVSTVLASFMGRACAGQLRTIHRLPRKLLPTRAKRPKRDDVRSALLQSH